MKKLETILLVDDDKINNYLNETLLKELAIARHIEVLTNGLHAFNYLREHCLDNKKKTCPALVIFDHHMPIMNGLELLQALYEIDFIQKQEIVFILLGIHTLEADIEAFQKLGVQEFTTKPLSQETVMDAYQKYFAGNTARDQTADS